MKVKKVMLGETSATEYTYDDGLIVTMVDLPPFDNPLPESTGPLMTSKWVIWDDTTQSYVDFLPEVAESWKAVAPIKPEAIEALKNMWNTTPKVPLTRFGTPYFKGLESFLEDYGFKPNKSLPWRYESDRYTINQVEDSDGNEEVNPTIYSIIITSFEETVYRGRLFDSTHAAYIFGMVAEHRYLTGKDDFPKLPIEPVKFEINRTSIWSQDERKSEDFPGTNLEELPERYGNVLAPIRYTNTKEFTTVQEMLEYLKEVKFPLIIDTYSIGDTIFPVLEIYDDYRE